MSQTLKSTPKQDGFRMPGEFEPHAGCWMLWPERPDNWRNGGKPAQQTFAAVAAAIAEGEPVTVCVSKEQYQHARAMLPADVRLVEMSNNDSWIRDCGPTFLVNDQGDVRGVDWRFNAWGGFKGGLYFPWDQDNLVGKKVLEIERYARYAPDYILEGGSIDVDGEGTLVVTEQCLLNENRNPDLSKEEIETYLKEHLNLEKIIWLGNGVYNDETDGHVDNFCRFVRPGVVVLHWTDDESDPQYAASLDALERLEKATDARGRKLEIHKLFQPGPLYATAEEAEGVDAIEGVQPRQEGDRLAGSYVNFYVGNGVVVMPLFNDPHDEIARAELQELYPDHRVITVPAREILLGGGCIHCITQQQPAGKPAADNAA